MTFRKHRATSTLFLVSAFALTIAGPPAHQDPSTKFDVPAAIKAIERSIQDAYVFPERRKPLVDELERRFRAHQFSDSDPGLFTQQVTSALQDVSHDGHLYLQDDLPQYKAEMAPVHSSTGMDAFERAEAIRDHHGLAEARILDGNVRYLRISGFKWVPRLTQRAYDEALRFLSEGSACIVDVRENPGGYGEAADCLLNAVIPPGTVVFTAQEGTKVSESGTRKAVVSLSGKPLYVLVDGHTGSAAEAFSYAVQQHKVGIIVGATTYGAANNNKKFPIAPRFVLSVSYHRPVSAVSGTNWEGVGVVPDVATMSPRALDTALDLALNRLCSTPNQDPKVVADARWALGRIDARLHPSSPSLEELKAWAGTYGPVELRYADGRLLCTRTDRPKWPQRVPLRPMSEDGLFSMDIYAFGDIRIKFGPNKLQMFFGSQAAMLEHARSGG